jgi:MFS family permease
VTRLWRATRLTFRSMSVRNYRLYFAGQLISTTGTWMQSIAQAWLVLQITGSGVALGITVALQFTPVLLVGAWGGLVADRVDKRRLLIGTQAAAGVLALVLGAVTVLGVVQLWMIFVLALGLGAVNAVDNPARRAFVVEMVGTEHVSNAVSLSSAMFMAARVIGPAIAGLVIAGLGVSWCFFANGVSYSAAVLAFVAMRENEFFAVEPVPKRKGQLREGLRYAWSTPALRLVLVLTAVIGTLAFNFQVVLPLLAKETFGGDAGTFGTMYALMSVGSVVGALVTAHQARATRRFLLGAALAYGVVLVVAAVAPTLAIEMLVLVLVGGAGIGFTAMANGVLQTETAPEMRGRVMALFSVAFLGSTPIGGPIVGWVSEQLGPRAGLWLGGLATLAVTAAAIAVVRRQGWSSRRSRVPATRTPTMPIAAR